MDAGDFFALVARMREAQRRYFKHRSSTDLEYSKALERQVDRALDEHADVQLRLFGPEDQAS